MDQGSIDDADQPALRSGGGGGGERSARVGPESNRAKQQDFQTFFQYLSVDSWHTLGSASVAECAKLELLVGAVLGLGRVT